MPRIGDRITVNNFACRHTVTIDDNHFYAYWEPEPCPPFPAIFLGWKYVYSGTVNENSSSRNVYNRAGQMITRTAMRVAVVQPLAGQQWRRARSTFIIE